MPPNRTFLHARKTFSGECPQQKISRRRLADSARAQVEESFLVNLPDSCSMRTLHVIRMNLQLRLRVDLRIVGEEQIAVGLFGIGLLCVFVHDDPAVKDTMSMIVQDSVIKLPAAAVRAGMLDQHVIIDVLMVRAEEQAVDQALASFAGQNRMHVVPHQCPTEQNGMRRNICTSSLLDTQR